MEGFNDLVEEIRKQGGQLMWITQKKQFLESAQRQQPAKGTHKPRTPEQIKQDVLQSARLRHCIDQLTRNDSSLTRESILLEAKKILDEMAHQFDLKYVRMLGYVLIKVFTRIYKHIYYNSDIMNNLQVIKTHPTIFLPLHRSYMDFLLISIICYHKSIQLPAIATGQDFLGLAMLSGVIRRTGAFFIRRSFGSDQLYWALFNEYVQQHMLNCDRPLEFFIEGMRSRTSKSLRPKLGMFSTCLETYLKGHRVEDIYLIPISLTYERLLEELLYSNELLGIPKPKESVSGLVKARTILNQCYGSIFINFSRPISVREMLYRLTSVNNLRPSMSLTPSFVFELTADQNKSIESLSFLVLIEMQRQQIIQPISLIATVLLHSVQYSIDLTSLIKQCQSLKRLLNNLGVKVYWPLGEHSSLNRTHENQLDEMTNIKSLVLYNIESHLNLFDLLNKTNGSFNLIENIKLASEEPFVNCSQFVLSIQKPHKAIKSQTDLLENASIYLAVCSYRNQLVNFLVRISFVCNCLLATAAAASSTSGDRLMFQLGKSSNQITYEMYAFLSLVYNREFIFREGDEKKDFTDAISFLLHTNLIRLTEDGVSYELVSFNLKSFLFLAGLFEPVLNNYLAIYSVLFTVTSQTVQFEDEKKLTKTIQQRLFDKVMSLKEGETLRFDYEALSFNLISNAMLTLRQFDVLKRYDTSNNKLNYEIDLLLLKDRIADKLSYMIETNRMGLNELIDFDLNQTLNEVHSRETCSSVSKLMQPKL